jgi:hypothetical protein
MSRPLSVVLLAVTIALAACGGGGSTGGGAESSDTAGGSGAAASNTPIGGDIPMGSSVIFGSAWDPASFAVKDKTPKVKQGTAPIVAVGRALAPIDGTGVKVKVEAGGRSKEPRDPDAIDNPAGAQLFAADLSKDGLTAGTWTVSFVTPTGRIVASGFLTVSP